MCYADRMTMTINKNLIIRYMKICLWIFILTIVVGIVLPFLYSSESDVAVLCGIAVTCMIFPVSYLYSFWVMK